MRDKERTGDVWRGEEKRRGKRGEDRRGEKRRREERRGKERKGEDRTIEMRRVSNQRGKKIQMDFSITKRSPKKASEIQVNILKIFLKTQW